MMVNPEVLLAFSEGRICMYWGGRAYLGICKAGHSREEQHFQNTDYERKHRLCRKAQGMESQNTRKECLEKRLEECVNQIVELLLCHGKG